MSIRDLALKRARNVKKIQFKQRIGNQNKRKCMCFVGLLKDCMGAKWNGNRPEINGSYVTIYDVAEAYNLTIGQISHGIHLNDNTNRSLRSILNEVFTTFR